MMTEPHPASPCLLPGFLRGSILFCFILCICISISSPVLSSPLCGADNCSADAFEISATIELLRGLDFKTQTPVKIQSPEQALDRVASFRNAEGMGFDSLSALVSVYESLGMLPGGFDLKTTFDLINKDHSRSMYVPADGAVYLTEPGVTPGWSSPLIRKTMKTLSLSEAQFILTRELGYSLLDQNFGLQKILSPAPGNSDRALAARSLAYGDAIMMITDFLLRNAGVNSLALQDAPSVIAHFTPVVSMIDRKQLEAMPASVRELVTFPFVQGYDFALQTRASGGLGLLNAAYSSPPLSTEQIIHPEKFFTQRDIPITIKTEPLEPVLGGSYRQIYNDVFGEMGLRSMLDSRLDSNYEAVQAAAGWGGDRVLAYSDGNGGLVTAAFTTWDTPQDATEFHNALARAFANDPAATSTIIGRDVVFLKGAPADKIQPVLETLWRSAKSPLITPPPAIEKISPDSPFFDQQLMMSFLEKIEVPETYDPEIWSVDGLAFTSRRNGFRIKAPNDKWRFQRFTLGRQIVTEFTAFHRAFVGSEITLETFDKVLPGEDDPIDDMGAFISRQMGKFKKISDRKLTAAGFPAREVVYEGIIIVPIKIRYTEVFAPEKTYVFTCAASPTYFKKLEPEFDSFISSLELLK